MGSTTNRVLHFLLGIAKVVHWDQTLVVLIIVMTILCSGHSWTIEGDPCTKLGISRASIHFGYAYGYHSYFFDGTSSGFLDNQYG